MKMNFIGGVLTMVVTLIGSYAAMADGINVVMTCDNGVEFLQLSQDSQGDYEYLAQRFASRRCSPFDECERQTTYRSYGSADPQFFQNRPTGIFSGEGVRVLFACGNYVFIDNKERTSLAFRQNECVRHD